jgi:hypothetical protein
LVVRTCGRRKLRQPGAVGLASSVPPEQAPLLPSYFVVHESACGP